MGGGKKKIGCVLQVQGGPYLIEYPGKRTKNCGNNFCKLY